MILACQNKYHQVISSIYCALFLIDENLLLIVKNNLWQGCLFGHHLKKFKLFCLIRTHQEGKKVLSTYNFHAIKGFPYPQSYKLTLGVKNRFHLTNASLNWHSVLLSEINAYFTRYEIKFRKIINYYIIIKNYFTLGIHFYS